MRSIIITGRQGAGKTELARLIASGKDDLQIQSEHDLKYLTCETRVIVFDGISSEKDWTLFKELSARQSYVFRKPYSTDVIRLDVSKIILIGITNDTVNKQDARHSFVYNLS